MKKVKGLPPLDASPEVRKDPRYQYHYSREERLARKRPGPLDETADNRGKKKGFLQKFFGGNKNVSTFVIFYIAIGVIVWGYIVFFNKAGESASRRAWDFKNGRKAEIRLVMNLQKHALNLLLNNDGKNDWTIGGFMMEMPGFTLDTNFSRVLKGNEYDVFTIPVPPEVSNISRMNFIIK